MFRFQAVPASRYLVFFAIATAGCAADLLTKHWVFERLGPPGPRREVQWLIEGYVGLETGLNEGALFGIGQGLSSGFVILSVVSLAAILCWLFIAGAARDWLLTVALGAVTGGIVGNAYDRLGLHGLKWGYPAERAGETVYAVRDWILLQASDKLRWPNFNIADSLLVCGVALLAWHALTAPDEAETSSSARPAETAG